MSNHFFFFPTKMTSNGLGFSIQLLVGSAAVVALQLHRLMPISSFQT